MLLCRARAQPSACAGPGSRPPLRRNVTHQRPPPERERRWRRRIAEITGHARCNVVDLVHELVPRVLVERAVRLAQLLRLHLLGSLLPASLPGPPARCRCEMFSRGRTSSVSVSRSYSFDENRPLPRLSRTFCVRSYSRRCRSRFAAAMRVSICCSICLATSAFSSSARVGDEVLDVRDRGEFHGHVVRLAQLAGVRIVVLVEHRTEPLLRLGHPPAEHGDQLFARDDALLLEVGQACRDSSRTG